MGYHNVFEANKYDKLNRLDGKQTSKFDFTHYSHLSSALAFFLIFSEQWLMF